MTARIACDDSVHYIDWPVLVWVQEDNIDAATLAAADVMRSGMQLGRILLSRCSAKGESAWCAQRRA